MTFPFFPGRPRRRNIVLALAAMVAIGSGVQTALASGTCVDACVDAFGATFENSRGDYFVLKDCATSDLGTGTVYCRYARLPAL